MICDTYRTTLYKYLLGQATPKDYFLGWLHGIEYMMEACGIDYKAIWKEVQIQALKEDKDITSEVNIKY